MRKPARGGLRVLPTPRSVALPGVRMATLGAHMARHGASRREACAFPDPGFSRGLPIDGLSQRSCCAMTAPRPTRGRGALPASGAAAGGVGVGSHRAQARCGNQISHGVALEAPRSVLTMAPASHPALSAALRRTRKLSARAADRSGPLPMSRAEPKPTRLAQERSSLLRHQVADSRLVAAG
jgi:hypothetical protein